MTLELFVEDPYLAEFEAKVIRNSGREIVLDRTAFYPGGSGQPSDKGELKVGPVDAKIIEVRRVEPDLDEDDLDEDDLGKDDLDEDDPDEDKDSEKKGDGSGAEIVHVLDHALPKTVRNVHATLDWPRRHRNMRYNTALALLSIVAGRDLGATVNAGRIRSVRARLDLAELSLPADDAAVRKIEESVNELIAAAQDVEVVGADLKVEGLPRAQMGGLYVKNTREIEGITVVRWMDRGSRGIRLEFTLPENTEDSESVKP